MIARNTRPAFPLWLGVAVLAITASAGLAGCGSSGGSGSSSQVTITADLPPETGPITSTENKGLAVLTSVYEKSHPGVTVDWREATTAGITQQNTLLITRASGGDDEDLVWEQYGPVEGGAVPAGILADLSSYLHAKDPYDTSVPDWLDTFVPSAVPYMESPSGQYLIVNSSDIATGIYYSKAAFARAGIAAPPTTWTQFIADLAKLKGSGVAPFLFADGGLCDPQWWEETLSSTLLAPQAASLDVDHSADVLSSKDYATGVADGVISMTNPHYAAMWQVLAQLRPYLASGATGYDACGTPTNTTPPLWGANLLVKGQVAMVWEDSPAGPLLDQDGYTGKWGVFQLPNVTTANTPYATGVNPTGVIGGPNGAGNWAVTTQRADSSMTSAKTKQVVNFLEYLTSPTSIST
jgi:hypothetical protein